MFTLITTEYITCTSSPTYRGIRRCIKIVIHNIDVGDFLLNYVKEGKLFQVIHLTLIQNSVKVFY